MSNTAYNPDKYVLVKIEEQYTIRSADHLRQFLLIEDNDEMNFAIQSLLANGARIFDTQEEYDSIYPPLSQAEIYAQGMEYWLNIPEEKWPKFVTDFFKKDNIE